MQHKDYILIKKIISEIDIGVSILGSASLNDFLEDEALKRALAMTVINMGELVKNISIDVRNNYPDVPWREVAGFRDIAAHKYQTLRMEDVYNVIKMDFPDLREQLIKIAEV